MEPVNDWIAQNFTQSLTSRQTKLRAMRSNKFKVGENLHSNCLCILNGEIESEWLNMSLDSYKVT